jgi:hypothetical protein
VRQRLVADADFEDGINISVMLERLLKSVPRICSTDAQLLMLEQYETLFGIYDHGKNDLNHPFAAVELHTAEDNLTYSLLYERMEQFVYHRVHEATGETWSSFLRLPCYEATEMMRIAAIRREKEERAAGNLTNELKGLKP